MLKRGQGGPAAGTAVLIAVIAALIVGFVILIPPQERAKLLEDDYQEGTASAEEIGSAVIAENLLKASPGRIDYLEQRQIEHPLPVVNIYTKTEAKVMAEKNVVYVKNSAFSEETSKMFFQIEDLENAKNALLSFETVGEPEGNLIIALNGDVIFNSQVQSGSITPIKIPQNLLKEDNEVVFSVSSPGWAFWSTNEISLQKVKLIADITSVETKYSKSVFLISETEFKNLQKTTLKFQPSCDYNNVGKLTITINGQVIYSGVPDCELQMVPLEFSPNKLVMGENEVAFQTEYGSYLLSYVKIISNLKEVDYPSYYFDLSYEQYKDVLDEKLRVRMTMSFVDVVSRKSGSIVYNGHSKYFDTKETSVVMDLSEDVVQGANSLKIKPQKTLEVREIKVDLVK